MRSIGLLLLAVLGLAGCDSTTIPMRGISGGGGGGGGATTASVTIGDNFFRPVQDTIAVNGTVNWTWTGANQHQLAFDDGATGSSAQTTGTFSRTFGTPGTYTYFCAIHGRLVMNGAIIVQ